MEMEKSKVLIQFLLFFRQSGDVLFFLYARRFRGYTATMAYNFLMVPSFVPHKVGCIIIKEYHTPVSTENSNFLHKKHRCKHESMRYQ